MSENTIEVTIDDRSIRKEIDKNIKTPFDAFNEYIWNSIDAGAKNIELKLVNDKLGIKEISIEDDGVGINYYELQDKLFGKFNVSNKSRKNNRSLPNGQEGYGRFSFFKFASLVEWDTIFEKDNLNYEYKINISHSNLAHTVFSNPKKTNKKTGTTVKFTFTTLNLSNTCTSLICDDKENKLKDLMINLSLEFAWVIELLNINLKINGKKLDYSNIIDEKRDDISIAIEDQKFQIKFIKWSVPLKDQFSRYYFIDTENNEVYTNTTTLNNKGDEFYHSIYIKSEYFDTYDFLVTPYEQIYKELKKKVDAFLEEKKKPYLEIFVNRKFEKLKAENIFPEFSNSFENTFKKPVYEQAVKDIIALEPKLFSNTTNASQKKIFLELINKLIDDDQSRESLYSILEILVDNENSKYLVQLKSQLEKYGLENVVGIIRAVEIRLETIKYLKKIFNNDFKNYSESDIQKIIEKNYWIFGEEYNLMIGSEEDTFNKLRSVYCKEVLKQKPNESLKDAFSRKQVDLFICADTEEGNRRKHLIVEIKKPQLKLIKDHYSQIEDYKEEVIKIPEFSSSTRKSWNYILMYRDISSEHKHYFESKIKDNFTGVTSDSNDFYKIFVIKWSDLLEDCEKRLNYLKERLESKKKNLLKQQKEEELESSPLFKNIQSISENIKS